jgi:hypothetical protein
VRRNDDQRHAATQGHPEQGQIDQILSRIHDRSLRNEAKLLELAGRHEASREREEAQNDLGRDGGHSRRREQLRLLSEPQIVLGGTHQARCKSAERM